VTAPLLDETGPAWRLLEPIPDNGPWAVAGSATAAQSLNQMALAVNNAVRVRQVVELATAIVAQLPERDYAGALSLIRQYVCRHFRFIRDPHAVELLRTPSYLLQRMQVQGMVYADCDDAAQVVATLGKALGFPAEFHAVSFSPGGKPLTHVYTVLRMPTGQPVEFDITRPAKFRDRPPTITGRLVRRV
jgi:transglutaminase-like putative cysteine protease